MGLVKLMILDMLMLCCACRPSCRVLSVPNITETVTSNSTTGCQTFELTIDVHGSACPTSSVPGVKPSCEDTCALVSRLWVGVLCALCGVPGTAIGVSATRLG